MIPILETHVLKNEENINFKGLLRRFLLLLTRHCTLNDVNKALQLLLTLYSSIKLELFSPNQPVSVLPLIRQLLAGTHKYDDVVQPLYTNVPVYINYDAEHIFWFQLIILLLLSLNLSFIVAKLFELKLMKFVCSTLSNTKDNVLNFKNLCSIEEQQLLKI
uniref:Uncharacterized protein n=1 Tax=Glossina brevipalpis TaxID=37001 RepID=A0A1A9WK60_9MUSC